MPPPRRTALWDEHVALGARMDNYAWAGMAMPWTYRTTLGAEQAAVRTAVGVVDASQLRVVAVEGPEATACLEGLLPVPVGALPPGSSRFTVVLNRRGRVVDEAVLLRHDTERYWITHGPGCAGEILAAFPGARARDDLATLAVQGPHSADLLARALDAPPHDLAWMHHRPARLGGHPVTLSRSGFTGELGYELFCHHDVVVDCWRRLLALGAVPYGYAAVDLLRLEVGFPVYPVDLAPLNSLWEAGLGWLLRGKESDFVGRRATEAARETVSHRLVGLRFAGAPAVPRGTPLVVAGAPAGILTSSAYAPDAGVTLALARLRQPVSPGTPVLVPEAMAEAAVVPLPFRPRRGGTAHSASGTQRPVLRSTTTQSSFTT